MGQVETIAHRKAECDGETQVLFCKSLNNTSDEDDDSHAVKRLCEEVMKGLEPPRKMLYKENLKGRRARRLISRSSLCSWSSAWAPISQLSNVPEINNNADELETTGTDSPTEGTSVLRSTYESLESCENHSLNSDKQRGQPSSLQRPPSRRPHLSPTIQRLVSPQPSRSPGPPRNPLTVQTSQVNPNTTTTTRRHLGPKQPEPKRPITTRALTSEELARLVTSKLNGHPLQNKTLAEFLNQRKRRIIKKDVANGRLVKKPSVSPL